MLRKKAATSCKNHSESKAVCYCKECKRHMCEKCKDAHENFFNGDDNHSVIPIESLTSFDLLNGYCPDHPDHHMDLMCNDCNGTKNLQQLIVIYLLLLKNFAVPSVREMANTKDTT